MSEPKVLATHYVLAVPDVQRTGDYFQSKLGFTPEPVPDPGWRFLNRDKFRVMLGQCPDATPPSELGDHSYFAYIEVDDIDALAAEYEANGVTFRNRVADKPWGMREFAIQTPNGHRIMFGQSLARGA